MTGNANGSRITLQEIDPIDIYGVNDRILDRIRGYFPKLKIVARRTELILPEVLLTVNCSSGG
ncbi:MAG: hypothetical protein KBS57_04625 [Alistipes sp.]|nr:hypothetical protein [Candidatus Minthomonas equi]